MISNKADGEYLLIAKSSSKRSHKNIIATQILFLDQLNALVFLLVLVDHMLHILHRKKNLKEQYQAE
jgi:hypothetical protein